ncbi:hypothetical protein BCR44DRAFT_1425235, partial [Catenaria anguillulae PL171]
MDVCTPRKHGPSWDRFRVASQFGALLFVFGQPTALGSMEQQSIPLIHPMEI